jgi:hypothetical protein
VDRGLEHLLELLGDRAPAGRCQCPVVDLADGHHLGRGPGEEGLVGGVQVEPGEVPFMDLIPLIPGDGHDRVPGDAVQTPGRHRRGEQHAVPGDEHVLAGPIGHESGEVQHDGLVVAALQGLHLGQAGVEVLAGGLRSRREDVLVGALPGRDLDPDTGLHRVVPEVQPPGPHGDGHVDLRRQGVQAHLAVAPVHQRTDVADLHLVGADGGLDGIGDLLGRVGDLHVVDARGPKQPPDVVVQPKHGWAARGLVRPDPFEHAAAVVEPVGQDMHASVFPVHERPVHPDLVHRLNRHARPPVGSARR